MKTQNNSHIPVDSEVAKVAFGRPVPGQSWAAHEPKSTPWQAPPQFVKLEESMNFVMNQITEEHHLKTLLDIMDSGMSIEALTRTILFTGFSEGKWTPNLMMLMHKPVMLALIALAHRAELKHVPVVQMNSFNKYHNDKFKQKMILHSEKIISEKDKNLPPSEMSEQQQSKGFMRR